MVIKAVYQNVLYKMEKNIHPSFINTKDFNNELLCLEWDSNALKVSKMLCLRHEKLYHLLKFT